MFTSSANIYFLSESCGLIFSATHDTGTSSYKQK